MGLLSLLAAALYYHPWLITPIGVIVTLIGVTIGRRT